MGLLVVSCIFNEQNLEPTPCGDVKDRYTGSSLYGVWSYFEFYLLGDCRCKRS
jgi:hypothetical protein